MNTNIYSVEAIKDFYEKIICWDKGDRPLNAIDFFCVAARKKYMTPEQKASTNLGNTCMMQKAVLKEEDFLKFYSKIQQVDASLDFILDRDNNYLPRSCMAFYMNVNHTDIFKSVKQFKHLVTDWDYDLSSLLVGTGKSKTREISKQFKTIQNNLLKSFQDPSNCMKGWIDIDCDINVGLELLTSEELGSFKERLRNILGSKIPPYIIRTHGGMHILINSKSFKESNSNLSKTFSGRDLAKVVFTPKTIMDLTNIFLKSINVSIKEIEINQNMSIPIPGTIQGGWAVSMY